MQSCQSGSSQNADCKQLDNPAPIPDFVRAWESAPHVASAVRRPSTLLHPQLYHEVIEPHAIFELDEKQADGSIETIFVVPFGCERCRQLKQACSRGHPACTRCKNSGNCCKALQGGYQRLPGPKYAKTRKWSTSGTCTKTKSVVGSPSTQVPTASRSHPKRVASRALSLSQAHPSYSERSVPSGSKRSMSPGFDPVPLRKKAQVTASRKKEAPRFTADVNCSAVDPPKKAVSAVASTDVHSDLQWKFVRGYDTHDTRGQGHVVSIPSNTPVPRVWTNSLGCLQTVFPELSKSAIGFSWFQSETPILLLDTNYSQGHWINSTTLNVDLLWDFSCHESELEPIVLSDADDSTRPHPSEPVVHSAEITLDHEANAMAFRKSYPSSESGSLLFPTCATLSAPMFSTRSLPSNGIPLGEQIHSTVQDDPALIARSIGSCPSNLPSPHENSPPFYSHLALNAPLAPNATPQPTSQSRIPLSKPAEVETLLESHYHSIPLLLWLSYSSGLVPRDLPPEYAYSCMGLFFISALHHVVIRHDICPTTGLVQGRVCWSLGLQWAPGGEAALFDCDSDPSPNMTSDSAPMDTAKDLLHPWWSDPTDTPPTEKTTIYYPRDLRSQIFSFIPLDFLAEFHPSESFPRGWFCKTCGMINSQAFFRHQICQSTRCRPTRDKGIPPGKIDSLSDLRDFHQSSILVRPTINIPSGVVSDSIDWDDGMQSWIYSVRNGVTLCHVFTGNQEHLQDDATALFKRIQCEVLLHREEPSSLHFTHRTRLLYPSDKSEVMVPTGTPNCVRTVYYTLCDFVHRYGEMDRPRFGELLMQAWANTGSKKGNMLRASKSPAVIHCLGARVVLNITPRGGYEDVTEPTAPDKGKGRARDEDRIGSPPTESLTGPTHQPPQDNGNGTSFIAWTKANKTPTVAENVDETIAAMDTMRQCCSSHDTVTLGPKTCPETEMPNCGVAARRTRKHEDKNKTSVPEISMTLVHGDSVVFRGDDFEYQIVRTGTTILVIGFPEEA